MFCITPVGDEPRPALKGEVSPCPLKHHQEAVMISYQEKDVHRKPRHPGNKTGELN
jgi:hypothetical protein